MLHRTINILIVLLPIVLASCNNPATINKKKSDTTQIVQSPDTVAWITSFREFRDAVYHRDKEKVKSFFTFPIVDPEHTIWDLTIGYRDRGKFDAHPTPFTEADFNKHFDDLFTKSLINGLLKIKTEELIKNGESSTDPLRQDSSTIYNVSVSYHQETKSVSISINFETASKEEDHLNMENVEYSFIYEFNTDSEGKLRFSKILMAG